MFSGFMTATWIVATIVAVVAGVVGFFVVARGAAFSAHAIPNGAFTGAAGAALLGASTVLGLTLAAVLAALGIGALGRHGRKDAVTALVLAMMLATGSALLSRTTAYAPELFGLLFGGLLGVGSGQILPTVLLGGCVLAAIGTLYRPLLATSAVPEIAATSVGSGVIDTAFLVVLACATALTVPVVGTLLVFSLMIGPPGAAQALATRPATAIATSVAVAVLAVWASVACAYVTNWPVGFWVGAYSALCFGVGRLADRRVGRGVGPGQGPD